MNKSGLLDIPKCVLKYVLLPYLDFKSRLNLLCICKQYEKERQEFSELPRQWSTLCIDAAVTQALGAGHIDYCRWRIPKAKTLNVETLEVLAQHKLLELIYHILYNGTIIYNSTLLSVMQIIFRGYVRSGDMDLVVEHYKCYKGTLESYVPMLECCEGGSLQIAKFLYENFDGSLWDDQDLQKYLCGAIDAGAYEIFTWLLECTSYKLEWHDICHLCKLNDEKCLLFVQYALKVLDVNTYNMDIQDFPNLSYTNRLQAIIHIVESCSTHNPLKDELDEYHQCITRVFDGTIYYIQRNLRENGPHCDLWHIHAFNKHYLDNYKNNKVELHDVALLEILLSGTTSFTDTTFLIRELLFSKTMLYSVVLTGVLLLIAVYLILQK